jgi:hypothetical protein
VLWLDPEWRTVVSVALAVSGVLLLTQALLPRPESLLGARIADLAECAVLVSLLPALVVATDLFSTVESWAGR